MVARRPIAGLCKTRLAAAIGPDEAARLYRVLLDDTLRLVGRIEGVRPVLAWADDGQGGRGWTLDANPDAFAADPVAQPSGPAAEHMAPSAAPAGFSVLTQRGETLGERLACLCAELLTGQAPSVVIVGADSPGLPEPFVAAAVDALKRPDVDVVLGPTADGGFYLLGIAARAWHHAGAAINDLLMALPAGTPRAFAHMRTGVHAAGLRTHVLPLWVDVDRESDLVLAARLLPSSTPTRSHRPVALREVYLHITDRCGGTCPHCYVSDAPARRPPAERLITPDAPKPELTTGEWLRVADEAIAAGATGFVIIGGDPFVRDDLLELVDGLTGPRQARVRLFFSRALDHRQVATLAAAGHHRLTPLFSIDGFERAHDALRGPGAFAGSLKTVGALLATGLEPVVNTVLLDPVLPDLPELVRVLAEVGVRRMHLILPHRRAGLSLRPDLVPSCEALLEAIDAATVEAERCGLVIDNHAALRGRRRVARDLCGAGCSLLAIDPYGGVSACPITCGDPAFVAGDVTVQSLEGILRTAPTLELLRHSHARDRRECRECPVVDACGGECWVQAHYAAVADGREAGYAAPFPYCDVVRPLLMRGDPDQRAPAERDRPADGAYHSTPDYAPFDCI